VYPLAGARRRNGKSYLPSSNPKEERENGYYCPAFLLERGKNDSSGPSRSGPSGEEEGEVACGLGSGWPRHNCLWHLEFRVLLE